MRKALLLFSMMMSLHASSQNSDNLYALYEEGAYTAVVEELTSPAFPEEWLLLADSYHKLGMFQEALDAYDQAEGVETQRFDLFLHRGICLFSLGAYEASRDDLISAYELDASDPRVPYYLAANAYMKDDFKMAQRYLEDALRLDPQYYDAHYLQGALYMMKGKPVSAEASFLACAELKNDDDRLTLNRALALQDQYRFEEAMELFDALVMNAKDTLLMESYYYRGHCRYAMHNETSACEDWANSADMGDDDAQELIEKVCSGKEKRAKKRERVYMAF